MGISQSFYLGPYIRCKTHKVNSPETIRSCVNSNCISNGSKCYNVSTNFCPNCGQKIESTTIYKEVNRVNKWHVAEIVLDQAFYTVPVEKDDFDYYLPNRLVDGFSVNLINGDEPEIEIDLKKSETGQKLLTDFFGGAIDLIKNAYGAKNVEICWGLIRYYM